MTKEEYIESIVSQIDDKAARAEFRRELEAHLDDRIAFYTDAGYDYYYALDKAIGRMGDTAAVGSQMNNLYDTTKVNKAIWIMTVIQCVMAAVFAISGADYYFFTPYIIINVSYILFTVTFLLAAKHKKYIQFCVISLASIVGFCLFPLSFDVFSETMFHDNFREIIAGWGSASVIESLTEYFAMKKYGFHGYYEHFLPISYKLSGLYQVSYYAEGALRAAFYPISSIFGIIYAIAIKKFIDGKQKAKMLKRLSKINVFNIACTVINILTFIASIFIFIVNVLFEGKF
ncbi:MAG: hypothetical protein IJR60_03165 [Eubacterium sp.]|nr:hypothetical protein [Eubacterium sp.]